MQFPRSWLEFAGSAIAAMVLIIALGADSDLIAGERSVTEFASYLSAGMEDFRQQLRTGTFRATGHIEVQSPRGSLAGDMAVFGLFDIDAGTMRMDRTEPHRIRTAILDDESKQSSETSVRDIRVVYCETRDRSMYFDSDDLQIIVGEAATQRRKLLSMFDVRAVGMMSERHYRRGLTVEEILAALWKREPTEISPIANSEVYRVTWVGSSPAKTVLWVDASRGFTPIRFESALRGKDGHSWLDPWLVSHTEWSKMSEVWVPTKYTLEQRGARKVKYEHSFEWLSINQPIPQDLLREESLGAKDGTLVIDYQANRPPLLEKVIGDDAATARGWMGPLGGIEPERDSRPSNVRIVLVVVNVLVLVVCCILLLYRARHRVLGR